MIRPPPRPTLFPTRRSSDLAGERINGLQSQKRRRRVGVKDRGPPDRQSGIMSTLGTKRARSEEHTSELQSHVNLVCRLLLEKKKIYQEVINMREYKIKRDVM